MQLDLCHIINIDTLKSIYFAYFHSTMKHGIILAVTNLAAKDIHFTEESCWISGWC
jgi:hypothetical protein